MRTSLIGVGSALALTLSATPVLAEDLQCPKPGTVMVFNNTGSITFAEPEGMICVARTADGKITRRLFGVVNTDFVKHAQELFPLKVGNEVEFERTADSSHLSSTVPTANVTIYYHDDVKVARQERITTKMGTFDTFVIEWHAVIKNHNIAGAWLYTLWFAPELGYVVKETDETRAGFWNGDKSWEITSLTLPSLSPTVATTTPPTAAPLATIAPAAGAAQPAPAATPTPSASSSVADRLNSLKDLLDRKIITPEEYAAKRKEILKSL